ncbi:MAG: hypothetical protein K8R92_07940 [Planctomycetes bacterium]|nr:hypothetical protein [Planctomycetota bacterium]
MIPAWRGTANTTYMGWENFTAAYGGANLPDAPLSANLGGLYNFGFGSTINGSNNIVGNTSPLFITMIGGIIFPQNPVEVVLNIAAQGPVINLATVKLSFYDNLGNFVQLNPNLTDIRFDAPFPGGRDQTLAFTWNLPANLIAATQWQINYSSSGVGTALDAASLDMRFIPAPGVMSVLAMLGGGGMICGRRRRL